MVTVSISETYDLKTSKGMIGLIGIHTPAGNYVDKMWDGLRKNFKFLRILGCDVVLTCASILPADPLQIGEDAGKIAPQDMFNPILFKAVTNESFETVIARMYSLGDYQSGCSVALAMSGVSGDSEFQSDTYYGLLAQPGWKKAMIQQGLTMRNLRPLCHEIVSSFGNAIIPGNPTNLNREPVVDVNGTGSDVQVTRTVYRGRAMAMPRIPTSTALNISDGYATDSQAVERPAEMYIPKTYVGCIVIPPAYLKEVYFRMRVVWHLSFEEPMNSIEKSNWAAMNSLGVATHFQNYTINIDPDGAKSIEDKFDIVTDGVADFSGADAHSVMVS